MKPVGYIINYPGWRDGEGGLFYNYVMAANGIWIEARGAWLTVRAIVATAKVRGLAPLDPVTALTYGKIPSPYFDLALSEMMKTPHQERYVAITYSDAYHVEIPGQTDSEAHVEYSNPDSVVVDLHSHGALTACFSSTDDRDDQGLRISGVIGNLNKIPIIMLRVGVYGYFNYINWDDVFTGKAAASGVIEWTEELEGKEVPEFELQSQPELRPDFGEHFRGRMWGYW